jgi:hypothetical protein
MLSFWVIPRRLNFICRSFGTNVAHPDTRPISFTYPTVASMWVVTKHNVFLYSDPPLPCHHPSYWLALFSSQTFSRMNTPTFLNLVILHAYQPMKMEQTECSETSAYKIQTPGNFPEESIQHLEHTESLKSRTLRWLYTFTCFEHNAGIIFLIYYHCLLGLPRPIMS